MREAQGDLWNFLESDNAVGCITTNGTVKNNGECVMGKGCAAQAKKRFPLLPRSLGQKIMASGNAVHELSPKLVSFPVKHNWWEDADLKLITRSAIQLAALAQRYPDKIFYLPRPGCGNGNRDWETEVKPAIEKILPDNVVVIDYVS